MIRENGPATPGVGVEISTWSTLPFVVLVAAVALGIGAFLYQMVGYELALLALPVAAAVGFVILHNERIWIFSALLGHALIIVGNTTTKLEPPEVVFGIWVLGGLAIWFLKELVIHRRRIVESGFDLLLVSFLVLGTIVSLIAAALYHGLPIRYLTEWLKICDLLLYFPLRKIVHDRRDLMKIVLIFVAVAMMNGVFNILTYRERLLTAVYEYEIEGARTASTESLSVAFVFLSAVVFGYARTLKLSLMGLVGMALGLVFLALTFSRGPIAVAIVMLVAMLAVVPGRARARLVVSYVTALVGGIILMSVLFPALADEIGKQLVVRIATFGKVSTDRSVESRVLETNYVLKQIRESPLIGHGFGVNLVFFDPIRKGTIDSAFMHNGWLWPIFKFGLPVGLLFFAVFFYPVVRLLIHSPRREVPLMHGGAVASVSYLMAHFVISLSSNQSGDYPGTFNMLVCWIVLDYINRRIAPARDPIPASESAAQLSHDSV
jgi:hypothetical protein